MRRISLFGLALSLFLGGSLCDRLTPMAQAFKLQPISRVFTPAGTNATQSYEITNTTKDMLAVEVSTAQRRMDIHGKEMLTPADEDFLIYPPQILLKPGATQTVRVTWLGDPKPDRELAYRLIANQLPINLNPKKPTSNPKTASVSVKLAMRYRGSLYIRPANVKADVVVDDITSTTRNNQPMLSVTLHNRGTSRAILLDSKLTINHGNQAKTYTAETLKLVKQPVLLVDHKRQILIPYSNPSQAQKFTGKFDLAPTRQ